MALKVNILEEKKNKLRFELDGDTQTIATALTDSLWKDEHVKAAGYTVEHPLVGKPTITVETDGEDVRKSVSAAAKRLAKSSERLREIAAKELR